MKCNALHCILATDIIIYFMRLHFLYGVCRLLHTDTRTRVKVSEKDKKNIVYNSNGRRFKQTICNILAAYV